MCGGSPKVDNSAQREAAREARRVRREEEARAGRVTDGLARIAAVFEGGEYVSPTGEATTYEGLEPYLDQREGALRDFYLPQLDEQRSDAEEALTFALARAGLLNSSVAGERQATLAQDYALQRGSVLADIAADIAGQRTAINQNRSSLEAGLRASGDATAASNAALASAATFRADEPDLSPLPSVLFGASQGLGAAAAGRDAQRLEDIFYRGTGATQPKTKSSRIVRSTA